MGLVIGFLLRSAIGDDCVGSNALWGMSPGDGWNGPSCVLELSVWLMDGKEMVGINGGLIAGCDDNLVGAALLLSLRGGTGGLCCEVGAGDGVRFILTALRGGMGGGKSSTVNGSPILANEVLWTMGVEPELTELEFDAEFLRGVAGFILWSITVGGAPLPCCSSYDVPLLEQDGAKLLRLGAPCGVALPLINGLLDAPTLGLDCPVNNSSLLSIPPFCIVTLWTMSKSLLLGIRGLGRGWSFLIAQLDIGLSSTQWMFSVDRCIGVCFNDGFLVSVSLRLKSAYLDELFVNKK